MRMLDNLLNNLKRNYNAVSLRIDLAAEVYTSQDLENLFTLSNENNISTTLKIGGCDSTSQIYMAKKYDVKSIISPMIETPYALKKFIENCKKIYSKDEIKKINLYPNIETITAYNNIDEILSIPEKEYINGFVLGRDDMKESANINDVNSDEMLNITKKLCSIADKNSIDFIIGGAVRPNAVDFLLKLPRIKHYETRMIAFDGNYISKEGIAKALAFEIEWLKFKQIQNKFDIERIKKLQNDIAI